MVIELDGSVASIMNVDVVANSYSVLTMLGYISSHCNTLKLLH